MDIRNVDLNLLVALDALLAERSVSRAAVRLHLSQPAASALLARLRELPGVGPFTAEAVWLRGCGIVDELPSSEEVSVTAARDMYSRAEMTHDQLVELAEAWRPFRMWATVLLRVGWGRQLGRQSYRQAPG